MFKSFYISKVFFLYLGIVVFIFVLGFVSNMFFYIGQVALLALICALFLDTLIVFTGKTPVKTQRIVNPRGNLGDEFEVNLKVVNQQIQPLLFKVYEGFPLQMQERNLRFLTLLGPKKQKSFTYSFIPKQRGEFLFGDIHVFISSVLNLVQRRVIVATKQKIEVYPSVLQMKQFELKVFNQSQVKGIKKIRRLGNNNEFEQIKNYVQGDDIRTINWKATSRARALMVNQYQEQRSQNIYSIIDKSRSMEQEFNGMSLLDYAINTTLVFSNIALRKGDKVGLLTYSDKMGSKLHAEGGGKHLRKITETLYNQKTNFKEADFTLLYQSLRMSVKSRSLLMLYTNFETLLAMRRALPLLRRMNKHHLLVVVFFENTDLTEAIIQEPDNVRDIYVSTVAENVANVKRQIALELNRNGIQSILTKPEELSIDTINKYLELKSRGLI